MSPRRRLLLAGTSALMAAALLAAAVWHLAAGGPSAQLSVTATQAAGAEPIGAAGPVEMRLTPAGRGWMVLNTAPYQVLEATADDGARWTDVGPPGITGRGGLGWSWSGPSTAWLAVRPFGRMRDTRVYHTTTAGRTWGTPAVLPGPPARGAVAPLAGDGSQRAGMLLASGLWTTGDGGAAWQRAAALPTGVSRAGLGWSPRGDAWLSGEARRTGVATLWTLTPGDVGGRGATAARGGTMAAGGATAEPGGQAGTAGTWRAADLPVPSSMRGLHLVTLPPLWSGPLQAGAGVVAVDGARQWLWWATTSDGGRQWHLALPPAPVEGALSQGAVEASAAGPVYALGAVAGGTAVWRGDLARGTWSQVGSPLPAAPGRAVDFPDPADGWVVTGGAAAGGGATRLWQTGNGGRTWQQDRVPALAG